MCGACGAELRVKSRLPEEEPSADGPGKAAGIRRCEQACCVGGQLAMREGGWPGSRAALVLQTCPGKSGRTLLCPVGTEALPTPSPCPFPCIPETWSPKQLQHKRRNQPSFALSIHYLARFKEQFTQRKLQNSLLFLGGALRDAFGFNEGK